MLVFKGLRFGMLLQLAIGPVFFFIFKTAAVSGFAAAETGTLGVFIIDGLYIFLAVFGVAAILEKKYVKPILKLVGAAVLFIFGAATVLGGFNIQILPAINLQGADAGSAFLQALILTASSPITILFWAGVFSAKIAELDMRIKEVYLFALGTLLATLVFMSAAALLGSMIGSVIPPLAAQYMNIAVGAVLILFGARMLLKKK